MAARKDDTRQQIAENCKESIVCLKTKFIGLPVQDGSGFFVAPDKIVTNIHVIEGVPGFNVKAITAKQLDIEKTSIYNRISKAIHNTYLRLFQGLRVKKYRQPKQPERSQALAAHTIEGVVGYDDKNDLVLLKAAEIGVPLPFGDIDALESDEQVYIVGYDGTQYKAIAGTIPNKNNRNELQIKIKHLGTHVDGHSGGPVLNSKGEVIGVVVSASDRPNGDVHSFVNVVPLTALKALLANSGEVEQVERIAAWRKHPQIRAYTKTDLGDTYLEAEKYEKAIAYYDAALHLNPNLAHTYFKRGLAKRRLGDFEAAITDYDSAIKINPEDTQAYINRGAAKRRLDDLEGAIEDYDTAIKLNPEDTQAYINRGIAKIALGDFRGTITDCDDAIKINHGEADAYVNRGFAKRKLDDFEGAIEDYDTAIKLNPEDTQAYINRGVAKCYLDDFEGAIDDYDNAIKINPEKPNLYNLRAEAKRNLGESKTDQGDMEEAYRLYEAAIVDYTETIRLEPKSASIYNERGWVKYLLGKLETEHGNETEAQGLFQEAVSDGDEALRLGLKHANSQAATYHTRGAAKAALGDHRGAIEDFSECIQLRPKKALYYHDRGLSKEALGQHTDAETDFTKAKELDPDI